MKRVNIVRWDVAEFMEREGLDDFFDFICFQMRANNCDDGALKGRKVMSIAFVRIAHVEIRVNGANDPVDLASRQRSSEVEIVQRKVLGITESIFAEHERTVHIKQQSFLAGKHHEPFFNLWNAG